METKARSNKNSSSNSNPFADLTNSLTPFSTLRKLCQSTDPSPANSIIPQENLPPVKQYSLRNPKPFNKNTSNSAFDDSCAAAKKDGLDKSASNCSSSKSDTSIGSSNFNPNNAVANPNCSTGVDAAANLTTPTRRVAPPQTPPLGDGGNVLVYKRRHTDVKARRAKEAISGDPGSSTFKKTRDKGKAIMMPSSCPITLEKVKAKGIRIAEPSVLFGSSSPGKNKDKCEATGVPFSRPFHLKIGKEDSVPTVARSDLPLERQSNQEKAILTPPEKLKDNRVRNTKLSDPFGSRTLEKNKGKGKAMVSPSSGPVPLNNVRDTHKAVIAPSYDHPLEARNIQEKTIVTPLSLCPEKTGDKRKYIPVSYDLKNEGAIFSCPPLPRTRSIRERKNNAEDGKPPNSWTDPHPNKRKKRCVRQGAELEYSLPRDFVEQQNAYFKEVDDFELPEEEVSYDDLE